METLYERCAGLDVHKKNVKVCLITPGPLHQPHKEIRTYLTTTAGLLQMRDWLSAQGCTHLAMESTGVYTPVASKAMWAHPRSLSQSPSCNNSSVVVK